MVHDPYNTKTTGEDIFRVVDSNLKDFKLERINCIALQALQHDLGEVFDVVVRVVNLIKKQPLQSRLFAEICREMGAEHEHLLVLQRVWTQREEVMAYLKNEDPNLAKHFQEWQDLPIS